MLKKLLATAVASLVLAALATPLKTAQGDVEIAKVPERIAVYDIGALDTLVTLGLGDKIVGIPGEKFAADFATPNAKEVGTLFEPDLEALNAAKPDLIIVASRSAGKLDEVKAVAQAVDLSVPGDNAYQEGLARLESLGAVFGKEAEAKKTADALNALRDAVKAESADKGKVLALLVNGPKIALSGPDSRAGWLQKELGLQLVHNEKMSGRHGDPVSFEYIAQENPDWIYALDRLAAIGEDGASAKQTLDNELVHGTTAWKKGQVVYLDSSAYLAAGGAKQLQTV
uniref:siderophore ABC transporter substrate-binding protein n=1 Tax=uncultured Cardiobacterium sp. TaxID=417619 RepID=UPI002621BD4E